MSKLVFSVTKSDCRFDYYKGTGAGGQKRNKTENCCRVTHLPSGAVGKSEEGRSKDHNKKTAFRRMAETKEFQFWAKKEAMKKIGIEDQIKEKVEEEMKNIKIEVKDNGRWTLEK